MKIGVLEEVDIRELWKHEQYVLAHLEGKADIKSNIQKQCDAIKGFCTGVETTA